VTFLPLHVLDDGLEIHAVHELHHDEVRVLDVTDVEHLNDVGVVETRAQSRLIQEHPDELLVLREMGSNPLDRDEFLEAGEASPASPRKTSAMPPDSSRSITL